VQGFRNIFRQPACHCLKAGSRSEFQFLFTLTQINDHLKKYAPEVPGKPEKTGIISLLFREIGTIRRIAKQIYNWKM
jgi:hypothetical protein